LKTHRACLGVFLLTCFLSMVRSGFSIEADCSKLRGSKPSAELSEAISTFKLAGGVGEWFTAQLPERLGGQTGSFFAIRMLPQVTDPQSPVFLLRTTFGREALQQAFDSGAPVIFGELSDFAQVEAAAIGGAEISKAALRVLGNTSKENIILLKPSVSVFTLAHEYRHWLDFENKEFLQTLDLDVQNLVAELNLNPSSAPVLSQITIEIRGHIVQSRQARLFASLNAPYVDRAGNIVTSPEEAKFSYRFEENQAIQLFRQFYLIPLLELVSSLNPQQMSQFVRALSKYDYSDDPQNRLTFANLLGVDLGASEGQ
jgi:hypothetical protein